ncbi:uncharacterized protein KY384_009272 [Bacidia gigantensis]|uniref:uncharacterized protein n=1 Tax=Bacidia gigantensis TaxID=2732470 RepID=UPI001D040A54|nr:uncharacterized protein KY384_009272 [Bacidia gigantensis]KAG8525628.1 hypothetical protein KY384_009272 [Bacidia gigantensis]
MSLEALLAPNVHKYAAATNGKYLSTRLLTHNGVTIAFALGRTQGSSSRELFFVYSILNAADPDTNEPQVPGGDKSKSSSGADKLDSQSWFENVRPLRFSTEIRVVGEEAVPVYQIPAVDRTNHLVNVVHQPQKLDPWLSTSLSLMDEDVTNFEVFSDGRYIYLFRQGRSASAGFANRLVNAEERSLPPIDGNLLCDRFNLVGSTISRTLEVRYRRSRQKRFPLNEHDTLAVRDINDVPFYEPTFSIRFVRDLVDGRFSVLQTPTMTNDVSRWMIFAFSKRSQQIDCFTTDVANDGLFDIHGQIYYTCESKDHEETFSNAPGSCAAISKGDRGSCGQPKQAIVPKAALSERAIALDKETISTQVRLETPISLSGPALLGGFTLEAWVAPISFWVVEEHEVTEDAESTKAKDSELPPPGSSFCLFSQDAAQQKASPSVFIDDKLRVVLRLSGESPILLTSDQSLKIDEWNHVALTYTSSTRAYALIVDGIAPLTLPYVLPEDSNPGVLAGLASQVGESKFGFQGQLDEVRLWRHPFHPATIKAKSSSRTTGMEPLLEACWHFDEGTGTKAYDSTRSGHDITILDEVSKERAPEIWVESTAPLVSNFGLTKRTLRLASNVTIRGGLGAGIYHEQVSVSQKTAEDNKEATKPLKRGARILLCFVASTGDMSPSIAILDFGLMSDGTLCDSPATLPLPSLPLLDTSLKGQVAQRASTALLYVDAQGMETFGGLFAMDAATCTSDCPCVWDSATGTISVFYRSLSGVLSALTYDTSRSVILSALQGMSEGYRVLASSKLRQAVRFDVQTMPCERTPENVAIDLSLVATMPDGSRTEVSLASYLAVGGVYFQVLRVGNEGESSILVSNKSGEVAPLKELPGNKDLVVTSVSYHHKTLVTCEGKPAGDFTQGSSMLTLTYNKTTTTAGSAVDGLVNAALKCQISTYPQSPFISSPPRSTALHLANDSVYTMLEDPTTTTACPGMTFESWIKVDEITESILVAYTSESMPRSERTSREQQTFLLGIPASSAGNTAYDLVGNANGCLFTVSNALALKVNQWVHIACSVRNTFALRFSGSNYVDLGAAPEWNVSDFSLVFSLQVDNIGEEHIVFTKAASNEDHTPLHITINREGILCLSYWAENEMNTDVGHRFVSSPSPLKAGVPYKMFISRALVRVSNKNKIPRSVQLVNMRAWTKDGTSAFALNPPSMDDLERSVNGDRQTIDLSIQGSAHACGPVRKNSSALVFGGVAWDLHKGLVGSIGSIRLYSNAIKVPISPSALYEPDTSERSTIGSWSFRDAEGVSLTSDSGRNHGKLKNEPDWILSPYSPDHRLSVFVNGKRTNTSHTAENTLLKQPSGPHQLTLGNALHGSGETRFLAMENAFRGQLDELRIWNVPRTNENITDAMNSRLAEVSVDLAVYLPFDDELETSEQTPLAKYFRILADASINCWHLSPLHEVHPLKVASDAPVSHDSPCVDHVLSTHSSSRATQTGAQVIARPSVAEYGDMQIGASGSMEGSYKRVYSYIDKQNHWNLVTGFRIGALVTEWVSQVQTSPTLIGYIEGAPPIAAENYVDGHDRPSSAIRFQNAQRCTYSYASRQDSGVDFDLTVNHGIGAKWQVSAGMGVESEVTSGEVKGAIKTVANVSGSYVNNEVATATTNTNLEMRVELTGAWHESENEATGNYEAANTGLALVESEVADVFALRLKTRGPVAPLVAYQMRPNPDIPKDRNLVSFPINNSYIKQGCLDGRRGLKNDVDYPSSGDAPKDASYYKPIEAYALKDRIRRQEEQLAGEYDRCSSIPNIFWQVPKRTHRNICNSYVWTADGGTFQETTSTMDFVQTEVGGGLNLRASVGVSTDSEVSLGGLQAVCNVDALVSAHTNLMQTKEKSSETSFELQVDFPPAIDIRQRNEQGKLVKRPGAVDAYRWMSFWLEPSVEGTDFFFQRVVDPKWLDDGQDPSARLLLQLREALGKETGNARTKAWRILHRTSYVSRVPENISGKPKMVASSSQQSEEKKSTLLADVSCNWHIIQNLEPIVRGASTRGELVGLAEPHIKTMYPSIRQEPRFYVQLLDLLGDYIGLE